MCGITGFFDTTHSTSKDAQLNTVTRMSDSIRHRGPDDSGAFIDAETGIALGFRRLAILDLSPTGHQPMQSADERYVMIFNGEIYNFATLRRELEAAGHAFATRSDSEVLLTGYLHWGEAVLDKLDGMFAFCLVDRERRETFLARDPLGVKPLFLREVAGQLVFASEIASLRRFPAPQPTVDPARLIDLVALQYVPGGRTVFREIRKLLPGHALHVKDGSATTRRWFSFPPLGFHEDAVVEDVAAQLSFSSEFYFSHFFRHHTGMTPTEFRQHLKG